MPRDDGNASGEPTGRKPGGWDEADVGAAGDDAPVGVHGRYDMHIDLICRTAVYVTRLYGGVGGGRREASPYPEFCQVRVVRTAVVPAQGQQQSQRDSVLPCPYAGPQTRGFRQIPAVCRLDCRITHGPLRHT